MDNPPYRLVIRCPAESHNRQYYLKTNPMKTLKPVTSRSISRFLAAVTLIFTAPSVVQAALPFNIIKDGRPAAVYYPGSENVVITALEIFSSDLELVCGTPLPGPGGLSEATVIVGVIGEGETDALLDRYHVDVSAIEGMWEAFCIRSVGNADEPVLFVVGSDARGAAYGVMELSRIIGVSPWVWWADVAPQRRTDVTLTVDEIVKYPSVQYRGIFLNDEDWGLVPWSTRTFEPTDRPGEIGPKTYSKIFELLLRLRANTIWPAMHECTVPFYFTEGNLEAAHRYGIVVGTSHCEPLMRTNTGEWDEEKYGAYNFLTNRDNVVNYWCERLDEVAHTENIYTLGMRGVHDGRMQGVTGIDQETEVLGTVIGVQRELLSQRNGQPVETIPQVFIPYKEVLAAYDNGLELPDDVTLVWCDDNHGHITRLSNELERGRSGGAGVYYHVSYWGKPHDYLWLATTQPSLVYAEMKRAWDYGARKLWILNVGDIKPAEYLTEFFLDLAWDIESVTDDTVYDHQLRWYALQFPGVDAEGIHEVMKEYYRLAALRKPEHMGWSRVEDRSFPRGLSPVVDTEFSPDRFSEIDRRLADYFTLADKAEKIYRTVPEELKPAFFQLVHYPVAASAAMNGKLLAAQMARHLAGYDPVGARESAALATECYDRIKHLDHHYNKIMLGGKWDGMMDSNPRNLPVFGPPELPEFDNITEPTEQSDQSEQPEQPGSGSRPADGEDSGRTVFGVTLSGPAEDPDKSVLPDGIDPKYAERSGIIALDAAEYTDRSAGFGVVEGLGHSCRAVRLPAAGSDLSGRNAESEKDTRPEGSPPLDGPHLEYRLYTATTGPAELKIGTIPFHPVSGGQLRYAVTVDGGEPEVVSVRADFLTPEWSSNVLRNQTLTSTTWNFDRPGEHIVRIYALDEELLVDQLMLDFRPDRTHYTIPTRHPFP